MSRIRIEYQWRAREALSGHAKLAVIAAEGQHFPMHRGFDIDEMRRAWEANRLVTILPNPRG